MQISRYRLLTLCIILIPVISFAQLGRFDASKLLVKISVPNNNYGEKNEAKAIFTFVNTNTVSFPDHGWKIFFNMKNRISIADTLSKLKLILRQGNLYSLEPTPEFKSVRPVDSISIKVLVENSFENRNDHPEGFYIVFDSV